MQLYHLVTFIEIFPTLVQFFNHISFILSNEYIRFFLKFLFSFFKWTFNYFKTTIFWKCKARNYIFFRNFFLETKFIWFEQGFDLWNLPPKNLLPKWESISQIPKHSHLYLGECFILIMSQFFALTQTLQWNS